MFDNLFKDPAKKFVAVLPDAGEPTAEFAPATVDKEEETATPETTTEVPVDGAAPAPAPAPAPAAKTEKAAATPVATSASSAEEISNLIASAVKSAVPNGETTDESGTVVSTPVEPTFAEGYLVNAGNKSPRRRPGKSMAPFMDIANNMKTGG